MVYSLHQNSTSLKLLHSLVTKPPSATTSKPSSLFLVRCGGPRSHRGPLVKGRTLSIEAIQAVQTLKRLHRTNPTDLPEHVSRTLSRLIKSDLLATLKELLRQDQCALALQVFAILRSEYKADLSLYAEMLQALAKNERTEDVDGLIVDLEAEGGIDCEDKGLINLIKAVIGAGSRESMVRMYGLMKSSGWGLSVEPDEYMVKVLGNGLKNFGEQGLAEEVENDYKKALARFRRVKLDKLRI